MNDSSRGAGTQAILLAAVVATAAGQTLVFAILPSLGRAARMEDFHVGLIISCSALVYALASPLWGRFSEYAGRKPVLLIGLGGYTLGTLVFATLFQLGIGGVLTGMTLLAALILARVLQASLMAGTPPAATSYIADITDTEARTRGMARVGAAHNLGTILGPGLGGMLAGVSLVLPLYAAAGVTAVMALLVLVALRESPWILSREKPEEVFTMGSATRHSIRAWLDRRVVNVLLVGVLLFMAFALVQQTLGFLFQDRLEMSPARAAGGVGLAMTLAATASMLSQAVIVQKLNLSPRVLLRLATPVMMAGVLLLIHAQTQWNMTLAVALVGLGLGLGIPGVASLASLRVGADEQGTVAGLMGACPALGFIVGPAVGTGLYQLNPVWPYWVVVGMLLPLSVMAWKIKDR